MKRTFITLMALIALSLSLFAQNNQQGQQQKTKVLVAYFSASGNTKKAATQLASITNADLHEIKPEKAYTEADLDWRNQQSRSSVEMKDKSSRPAITDKLKNMADYDVVYVGFPIWWYTAPTIINTFIEAYNLKGKKLIPFATSGSSDITKACDDLKAAYPELQWKAGKLLKANTSAEEITSWVKSNQ